MSQTSPTNHQAAAPRKSSWMLIVLSIFGVLCLLCCGGCIFSAFLGGNSLVSFGLMGSVLPAIQNDEALLEKLGTNIQPTGLPKASNLNMDPGGVSAVEFDIAGSEASGTVHAEVVNEGGTMKPQSIRVTTPDGWSHDVDLAE